jgi:hypothetical protein
MTEFYKRERANLLAMCLAYWQGHYGNKVMFQQALLELRQLRKWARA